MKIIHIHTEDSIFPIKYVILYVFLDQWYLIHSVYHLCHHVHHMLLLYMDSVYYIGYFVTCLFSKK